MVVALVVVLAVALGSWIGQGALLCSGHQEALVRYRRTQAMNRIQTRHLLAAMVAAITFSTSFASARVALARVRY
jgi:hypothetical protein